MRQVKIGSASEFADPGRRVFAFERFEVAVFKLTEVFAYLNQCRMQADLPARVR
jgi:nitrite reductase/ring-hydroxylating ferredoxin subunit